MQERDNKTFCGGKTPHDVTEKKIMFPVCLKGDFHVYNNLLETLKKEREWDLGEYIISAEKLGMILPESTL